MGRKSCLPDKGQQLASWLPLPEILWNLSLLMTVSVALSRRGRERERPWRGGGREIMIEGAGGGGREGGREGETERERVG